MNLKQMRAAALKAAQDIIEAAKKDGRDLTEDEQSTVNAKFAEIEELDVKIKAAEDSDALMAKIAGLGVVPDDEDDPVEGAKSLGEHFVKSVGQEGLSRVKTIGGATIAAPEFKASSDTHKIPSSFGDFLTDYDQTIVRGYRRPTVADLFGTGTVSGNAVTYLVEDDAEGDFTTVAEAGSKPQIHFKDPTTQTDSLKKIAAFLTFSDEMAEDAPFWVSEINNRGLYMLSLVEETQLLSGDGTSANLTGLLERSGVQTETATDNTDNADALFRALTKVQTATGLSADALVINPSDYQSLRLGKDSNGQYFGGGYFAGEYGNGGVVQQPPLWGLRTVVSSAVDAKTAIVGAFNVGGTVYRKGGIRVESTNSHASQFTTNLITTRIEERIALAVRVPKAFVKVTLSTTDPA